MSGALSAALGGGEKPRICFVITELALAGAEKVLFELARGLSPRWAIRVVALKGGVSDPGEVTSWLREAGIEVELCGLRGPLSATRLWAVRAALRRAEPQLIHAHLFHGSFAAHLLGPRGVPVISSWHLVPPGQSLLRRRVSRFLVRRDAMSVGVSAAVAGWLDRELAAPRVRTILNGLTLPLAPRAIPITPGEAPLRVAFVGRLDRQKGLDQLLRAWPGVLKREPQAQLRIAGRGPEEHRLRALARELGIESNCEWLGFQLDPTSTYAAADIVVLPSRYEGFGLVALEAMAAGRPIICTQVPGLSEVGLGVAEFVAPEDVPALSAAVLKLWGDPAARGTMAQRAQTRAEELSATAMIGAHEDLYRSVLRL